MREYILQMDGTYFGIFLVLITFVPPWILYLDKFFPLVEQKKEAWLNDFIPWAWKVYTPTLFILFFIIFLKDPTHPIFYIWLIGTISMSIIINFISKPINIRKKIYWCLFNLGSTTNTFPISDDHLDIKKWENSFIRKFIICHFWSSLIMIILIFGWFIYKT